MEMEIQKIHINRNVMLPDNDQWENRFEIHSETSDRVYVVAQHKMLRHWGCSCMGWKRYRKCKHLSGIGLPNFSEPHEVMIEGV